MNLLDNLRQEYAGRSVFVTGHTGFKGSWLTLWLALLGAKISGYALAPESQPNLFQLAQLDQLLRAHTLADVRDSANLTNAMQAAQPELVLHLAAQPLVRAGYRDPSETWSTNVLGTVNLLEAARHCPSVKAVIVVTTDKCYQNRERRRGYREDDRLGGDDPYSASKAAAELAVHSYRKSFFADGQVLLASARAGNVIGGGDWCAERLLPDAARAAASGQSLTIRNPASTRPWQHVLEALHGYLLLGGRLLEGDEACADAFNFGPHAADNLSVATVLMQLQRYWPELQWQTELANASVPQPALVAQAGVIEHNERRRGGSRLERRAPQVSTLTPHEAQLLFLNAGKAQRMLHWTPRWQLAQALEHTARWYRSVQTEPHHARALCEQQLQEFCR